MLWRMATAWGDLRELAAELASRFTHDVGGENTVEDFIKAIRAEMSDIKSAARQSIKSFEERQKTSQNEAK